VSDNPFLDMAGIDPGASAAPPPPGEPRADRNNNPGNLRYDGKSQWQGMTGVDPQGFVQFDTPANGQRALGINLANQANLHGLDTVRGIISKYAPPSDGNDTGAYVAKVAQTLGVGPDDKIDPNDPRINQVLQSVIVPTEAGGGMPAGGASPPPAQDARNPFLEMAGADMTAGHGGVSPQSGPGLPDGGSADGVDGVGGGPDPRLAQSAGQQLQDWASGAGHWAAGLEPLSNKLVNGVPIGTSLRDNAAGLVSGAASVPETLMDAAAWVTEKTGDKKSADTLRNWSQTMADKLRGFASNPDSTMYKSRELAGMIAATAPVAEIDPLSALARSARAKPLATALARYADMAAQGGSAGALTSRGENVGENAAAGALLAPALGAVVDKGLPLLLKAGEKVSGSKLAQALRSRMATGAADAAPAAADAGGDSSLAAQGWKPDEIAQGWRRGADGTPEYAPAPTIRRGNQVGVDDPSNANGGVGPDGRMTVNINGGVPEAPAAPPIQGDKPPIDPATLAAAVRAAGNKGGEITPASYVDAYLAGKGRGTTPEDLSLQQYAANNGPEVELAFKQRQWRDAVDQMTANQGGEVPGAIEHPDVGPIDVVWGNKDGGLQHIMAKHPEVVDNLPQIVRDMDVVQRTPNRVQLESADHHATVRLDYDGQAKKWLLTAFKKEAAPALTDDGRVSAGGQDVSPDRGADASIAQGAAGSNDVDRLRAALGSRGARRGLESDINWPPEVQAHAQQLVAEGMPLDHALREAEITYAGGRPTLAHVTRNPADQRGMWEGAKQDTPEGQQLATQIANNNNALHSTIQGDIGALGGVPAQGEATEAAARSLARDADRGREEVSQLYHQAEQSSGQVRVAPEEVYAVVSDPRHQAAVTNEGAAFIRGLRARLDQLTRNGRRGLTGPELDQLHQHASFAFDPMTSKEVNKLIWEAKDAINFHLDQIGEAGPAYARARAAHRNWAEQYENPEGVRKLIARNVEGAFKHDDNWRRADGLITTLADRPFIQVVKQLRRINDSRTLDRMKATVIQSAYEYATGARGGNAVDMLGNSPVSGKLFLSKLDAIGMPKLQALFSPAELGRLATIGRAASHLNEAVPGTVNTSGTASTLINALRAIKGPEKSSAKAKIAKSLAHLALGVTTHGAGNVALEGVSHAAGASQAAKARAELAEQLRLMMDPSASRAADRAASQRLADNLRRRATARTISSRTPPIVGSAQQQQRQK
jgi:hypothetical protein